MPAAPEDNLEMVKDSLPHQPGGHELHLHDETIQALFGLGLRIEYCIALFDESPDQAKAGLDSTITDLGVLIAELRARIDNIK